LNLLVYFLFLFLFKGWREREEKKYNFLQIIFLRTYVYLIKEDEIQGTLFLKRLLTLMYFIVFGLWILGVEFLLLNRR
jgi:hypothetical protein